MNSLPPGHNLIQPQHLEKLAYVYVRQSTMKQVRHNQESQHNQRQMVARAQELGWSPARISVIDDDLGKSGQQSANRTGFQRLVADLSLGRVGIILGYEASRLARNNRDWYHLIDLAALMDTLIADADGVYDPNAYNHRLLLGVKGTMSEFELHLLHQRLAAGRLRQVERGTYRQNLPTGLQRTAEGAVEKDPDQQVQQTIALVLDKFAALGSCGAVLRYCRQQSIHLPRRQAWGPHQGQVLWKAPTHTAIYEMVRNPAYAGAFVYGRKQTEARHADGQFLPPVRVRKPQTEWLHIQHAVYPAYIDWEQFQTNQAQLHANGAAYQPATTTPQGTPRAGRALLHGYVRCGHCGYHMHVNYKVTSYHYQCHGRHRLTGAGWCPVIHGPSVDACVVQAFFAALQPAQLDALQTVLDAQAQEHAQLETLWSQQLQRADYAVQRAQRQYLLVDPENRLVATELERRWETALEQQQRAQAEVHQLRAQSSAPQVLSPELRAQFADLSQHLPELWDAFAAAQQKALLRTLIQQAILTRTAPDQVQVKIVWVSGAYSELTTVVPTQRKEDVANFAQLVTRIGELFQQGLDDPAMAAQLTAEGFHTAHRRDVAVSTVRDLRQAHGWHQRTGPRPTPVPPGWLTTAQLAQRLGVNCAWIYVRLKNGAITAADVIRDPQTRQYLIRDAPALIVRLRSYIGKRVRFNR